MFLVFSTFALRDFMLRYGPPDACKLLELIKNSNALFFAVLSYMYYTYRSLIRQLTPSLLFLFLVGWIIW